MQIEWLDSEDPNTRLYYPQRTQMGILPSAFQASVFIGAIGG